MASPEKRRGALGSWAQLLKQTPKRKVKTLRGSVKKVMGGKKIKAKARPVQPKATASVEDQTNEDAPPGDDVPWDALDTMDDQEQEEEAEEPAGHAEKDAAADDAEKGAAADPDEETEETEDVKVTNISHPPGVPRHLTWDHIWSQSQGMKAAGKGALSARYLKHMTKVMESHGKGKPHGKGKGKVKGSGKGKRKGKGVPWWQRPFKERHEPGKPEQRGSTRRPSRCRHHRHHHHRSRQRCQTSASHRRLPHRRRWSRTCSGRACSRACARACRAWCLQDAHRMAVGDITSQGKLDGWIQMGSITRVLAAL